MKMVAILMTVACLTTSAAGLTQDRVSMKLTNVPILKVFQELNRQTGVSIIYNQKIFKDHPRISIDVKDATVTEVLEQCIKGLPVQYKVEGKKIVILVKPGTADVQSAALPPPIDITGRVTDEDGNPLAGASVKVKGTTNGATTDNDGVFVLKNVDEKATLEISFVGYEAITLAVNNRTSIFTSLKMQEQSLNEVVINKGYYTEKKRLSTGNVSTVTSKDINKQPVNNPFLALQGRVPGMIVTQTTGVAGGAVNVQVRGQNSIAQGNAPLYIVDGVPYGALPSLDVAGLSNFVLGDGGRINPLNYLNPSDILSIEVLKDADATAIYGSRGSNGVILITTKKGQIGATNIDINIQSGFGKVNRRAKLMNTQQYLEMRNEAFANSGTNPSSTDYDINGQWSSTASTDWQDLFIGGTAYYNDYQATISGGGSGVKYRVGAGYHKESTVFPVPDNFNDKKTSAHFSLSNSSSNNRFNMLFSGSYMSDINRLPWTDFTNYILLAPNAPSLENSDGSLNWNDFSDNPFRNKFRTYKLKSHNLIGNATLGYQILNNLEFKTSIGYTSTIFDEKILTPSAYFPPPDFRFSEFNDYTTTSWIFEPQLNYDIKVGRTSKLNALLGATLQGRNSDGQAISGYDYPNDALLGTLAAANTVIKDATIFEEYKYTSLFGRLSYDWNQTYLLNLTVRSDGSSRFGPGSQFGNFGAVGLGWIFTNGKFIQKSLPFMNYGKIRASYGIVGNEPGRSYQYLELFNFIGNIPYQGGASITPNNLPTPGYAWEENKKLEVGLEMGLFKDRVVTSVSFYRNRCGNQLVATTLPTITGFSSITANLRALVENSGWEITLNSVNVKRSNFTWSTTFNISTTKNELLEFPDLKNNTSYRNRLVLGEPITIQKVFKSAGVNPQTGIYQFFDAKGLLTSSPNNIIDRIIYVNSEPTYYGGLQNTFEYKNFQADIFFQFVKSMGRNYLFNTGYAPGQFVEGTGNQPEAVLQRWRKPGDIAQFQRFHIDNNSAYADYAKSSDVAYSDASFIRLKNVSISYRLPKKMTESIGLNSLRIYTQAQNLLTITNYKGVDPENQTLTSLPPLRVITAGIQLSF